VNYFPPGDRRSENQAKAVSPDKVISLDPGVRKFLTGIDLDGSQVVIGSEEKKISALFDKIDTTTGDKKRLWAKLKNCITDLHWKTIKYLTDSYGTIVLGDIHTQSILRGKLKPKVKRKLQQYSFCQFKTKLAWKCSLRKTKMFLVDEVYTSKTCCRCGEIKRDLGSNEIYCCQKCDNRMDRDVNGATNILIKTITKIRETVSSKKGDPKLH
jgi:putative transposase